MSFKGAKFAAVVEQAMDQKDELAEGPAEEVKNEAISDAHAGSQQQQEEEQPREGENEEYDNDFSDGGDEDIALNQVEEKGDNRGSGDRYANADDDQD